MYLKIEKTDVKIIKNVTKLGDIRDIFLKVKKVFINSVLYLMYLSSAISLRFFKKRKSPFPSYKSVDDF